MMEKYINEFGKTCYRGATEETLFNADLFYQVSNQPEDNCQYALHTNLGSLTVLDRMTGFGWRDVETGFRAPDGNFWLASCNFDVRKTDAKTLGEAIQYVKNNANTCIPDRDTQPQEAAR